MAKIEHVAPKSVDAQLAEHLKKAEEHLIAAVKLFAKKNHPDRHANFIERLTRHQEGVTTLLREELVRMRGPLKVTIKKAVKK